jgi:transcriptional regulator with XRE-family HTH domain
LNIPQLCLQMSRQRTNKILISNIAIRIKKLRDERRITQEKFFIDTDIHIARIESGKSNITVSTLSSICEYLDISLTDFFNGL